MKHLADRPSARARLRRRSYGIHAYVGPNGSGKSAVCVYDTLPSLDAGRPVLSTVRLLDWRNPRPCDLGVVGCDSPEQHQASEETGKLHQAAHPLYVPLTSYTQLVTARNCDVLLDEVTGVASSRESMALPTQIANLLVQLRRRDICLRWTTPSWGRADKIIREVTQAVTLMWAGAPMRAHLDPANPRLWRPNRLFQARTYDPQLMEEFEAHRADALPHEVRAWYWGPGARMWQAYDTFDPVTALGWANDAGMCLHCGGKRRVPGCSCEDHRPNPVLAPPARRLPLVELPAPVLA